MFGYRNIEVTVPSGHKAYFIKMGPDKLSPDEANDLAQFMLYCANEAADAYYADYCPEDMSLQEWYDKTVAHITNFVEV